MAVMRKFWSLLSDCVEVRRSCNPSVMAYSSQGLKAPRCDLGWRRGVPVFRQAVAHGDLTAVCDSRGRYSYSSCRHVSGGLKAPRCDLGWRRGVPVFRQAVAHGDLTAVCDSRGRYSYRGLLLSSCKLARDVSCYLEGRRHQRVAVLCPSDASFLLALWACWISGQTAVPLPAAWPPPLLARCAGHSGAELLVAARQHARLAAALCLATGSRLLLVDDMLLEAARRGRDTASLHAIGLPDQCYGEHEALVVCRDGPAGTPAGAVFSHRAIQAQVCGLVEAWRMSAGDCVLHVSPLHRLSGVVNELLCPLSVGATCVMLPKFDPAEVWSQLLYNKTINVLIATPNVYVTLIEEFEKSLADKKGKIRDLLSGKIRLMASGFGALPQCAWQRWQEITGHAVLQSYGRTETGTVMSGSLAGQRRLGCVGTPLPGVEVKLVGSDGCTLLHGNSEETRVLSGHPCRGVLQVRGPGLFTNYSNQPAAGSNSADGWFSTGDVVQYQNGMYKVLEVTDVNEEETACGK